MSERIVKLIRHGRAAAGWGVAADPDLDDEGRAQSAEVAAGLRELGPLTVVSSPLLRCRSTAQAYADLVDVPVDVVADVAEIPSPPGIAIAGRAEWLRGAMGGTWAVLGDDFVAYRDRVVGFVQTCPDATVVFSHFIAINSVIGACLGDDRLVVRRLDNCSVTTVAVDGDRLRLVEGGREADTQVR